MERSEEGETLSVYEKGYDQIESVLEDDELSAREQVEAIADIVYGDDEESNDADVGE
jgi:hypothetical protein